MHVPRVFCWRFVEFSLNFLLLDPGASRGGHAEGPDPDQAVLRRGKYAALSFAVHYYSEVVAHGVGGVCCMSDIADLVWSSDVSLRLMGV